MDVFELENLEPDAEDAAHECQVSVVLAAYNEEACIRQELERIRPALEASPFSYEVIVVDDGSTDATRQQVEQFPWARLLCHRANQGSGAARKSGTLAARGEFVVWSDVDLSYPNQRIPELVQRLIDSGADQVVGARDSERGTLKMLRVPAKYFIRKLACFLTGTQIPDLNSGMRAFRREVGLRYIDLLPKGFSCVTTLTLAFLCNGHAVEYLPISYHQRQGRSKFHPIKDTYRYFTQVARMITYFEPLKIFLPICLLLLGAGLLSSVVNLLRTGTMQEMDVILMLVGVLVGILGLLADLFVQYQRKLERLVSSLSRTGKRKQLSSSDRFRGF
jgi:glycosyltransferase involved in cell wall biosynthesis